MTSAGTALVAVLLGAAPVGAANAPSGTPLPSPDIVAFADVVGAPRGVPLSGATLEAETRRVGLLLRCPVCQGLSITDSPAEMAVNMRGQVREMLAVGYSESQILAYFERSYGEFVRLEPALRGVNWTLWLAPLAGLVAAGLVLAAFLRRSHGSATPATVGQATGTEGSSPGTLPDDPQLAEYVRRVRAIVARGRGEKPQEPRQP